MLISNDDKTSLGARRAGLCLATLLATLLTTLLGGCSGESFTVVPEAKCQSGFEWTAGDAGSAEMHPGRDCVQCHVDKGGPRLTVAGTIYDDPIAVDECAGVDAAEVILTDATGLEVTFQTGTSGNFYATVPLQFPLKAAVRRNGQLAEMTDPVPHGSCNECHNGTIDLTQDWPGRILAP